MKSLSSECIKSFALGARENKANFLNSARKLGLCKILPAVFCLLRSGLFGYKQGVKTDLIKYLNFLKIRLVR